MGRAALDPSAFYSLAPLPACCFFQAHLSNPSRSRTFIPPAKAMMIQHQRFQLGGRVEEIEIETNTSSGKQYVLLRDVQDVFPTAARFERDGRPVRFQSDEQGHRLEPWRVSCFPDSTLQIIPARQPMPITSKSPMNNGPPSPIQQQHTLAASPMSIGEDWRDYLLQRGIRGLILVLVLSMTLMANHGISAWLWYSNAYTMVACFWKVVTMTLFVLSVVWFLMLVALFVEVVWFLVRMPIATKRSMYQRLFDF